MKNINNLLLFGDSWIEGQGMNNEPPLEGMELRKWRRENSWNKFLKPYANKIYNFGSQGCSNYAQYDELRGVINKIGKDDLVVIGFTSKLRDTSSSFKYSWQNGLLKDNHPMNGFLAWEQVDMKNEIFPYDSEYANLSKEEEKFLNDFKLDFMTNIFDESIYENVAQTNLLFLESYFKLKNIKRIYFDLFEPYVNPSYVKDDYWIPKNYITYGKKTAYEELMDWEKINFCTRDTDTVWECGHKFPKENDAIWHPNENGYKYLSQWLINKIKKIYE